MISIKSWWFIIRKTKKNLRTSAISFFVLISHMDYTPSSVIRCTISQDSRLAHSLAMNVIIKDEVILVHLLDLGSPFPFPLASCQLKIRKYEVMIRLLMYSRYSRIGTFSLHSCTLSTDTRKKFKVYLLTGGKP